MRIDGSVSNIASLAQSAQGTSTPEKTDDFGKMLMDVMKEVNEAQTDSTKLQNALMTGQPVEYHELMIAMERASTAMQLTMQVRNKLLDAYTEISRMQV